MIQVKCIQKFRDKNNHIYGYRIVDLNGQTQDVQPEKLKQAIKTKQLHVINLRLTSDDRLVDTTEKQLQAYNLGGTPAKKLTKAEANLAKIAEVIGKALGYKIDTNYIDEKSVTLLRKDKLNTNLTISKAEEYYDKETAKGPNTYVIYFWSEDLGFRTHSLSFEADKNGISTLINKLSPIINLFKKAGTPDEIIRIVDYIASNIDDGSISEERYADYMYKDIASKYGVSIDEVKRTIQSRISTIMKDKKYLSKLRKDIMKESSKSIYGIELTETNEYTKQVLDEAVKAGVCFAAVTSDKENAHLGALNFMDYSDLYDKFTY